VEDDVWALAHLLKRLGLRLIPATGLEVDLADVFDLLPQRLEVSTLALITFRLIKSACSFAASGRSTSPRTYASESVVRCSRARKAVTSDGER
jgi:hypothetical protein